MQRCDKNWFNYLETCNPYKMLFSFNSNIAESHILYIGQKILKY